MDVRATANVRINPTREVVRTVKVYGKGLQFCVNQAWKRRISNNVRLHPFVYKSLRKRGLQSQLAIACIKQACGIVKKAKNKPVINQVSVRYNFPRSASFKNDVLGLVTVKGRQKFSVKIPECYKTYFSWDIRESLLRIDRKGRCFFIFTFSKDINATGSDIHKLSVLGVDVGVNSLAVTSNRRFYGRNTKSLRIKRDRLVGQLQAKGTKSAKRKLRKFSGRWKRFMTLTNHNISKEIVGSVKGGTIVLEDLKGIRESAKYNKWVHKWAFRQLLCFIEYKAVRKGIRVVYSNPYRTSKTCNRCQSVNTVRHSGFFECLHCGFSFHSDLNASFNIAKRYMRNVGGAFVTTPNVSGDEHEGSLRATECEFRDNQSSKTEKPTNLLVG